MQNTSGLAEGVTGMTNQTDRASKMVKLNDGRATASQAVNIASPMPVPLPSSGIQGRQPMRTEETPDTGKQVTQVVIFRMMFLSICFRNVGCFSPPIFASTNDV